MADNTFNRRTARARYKLKKHAGGKPRLSVHRSGQHIYAQLIDDTAGVTVASASSLEKGLREEKVTLSEKAKRVGILVAQRAKEAKVEAAVFDRGGYIFHGRVKALAEGAREAGLKF